MPSVVDVLAWTAALITAVGGIYIAIHETRRRERRTVRRELDEMADEISTLRVLLLQQRQYIYKVAMILVDHGIDVPRPPDPSFDRDEYPRDDDEHGPSSGA